MKTGDFAEMRRSFDHSEMAEFSALAGIATLPEAVPEPLIAAMFSYLLGVRLPGPGTNYLKQEMRFMQPAPLGEPLTARVEITRIRPDKDLVDLWATCKTADGTLICEGRSLVLAKDVGA